MTQDLTDIDPKGVLARVEGSDLASWSDDRRNEFCQTFDNRVRVARYILVQTSRHFMEAAERRHFISAKHHRAIIKGFPHNEHDRADAVHGLLSRMVQWDPHPNRNYHDPKTVGGREPEHLDLIAAERSKELLASLPPITKAVAILDAETAKKMDRRDKLQADGEKLREKLDEVCGVINMSDDQWQKMTVLEFRTMVKDRDAERQKLIGRMNAIAKEGQKLEEEIAKALYAGLPGISEAVVDVIRTHIEQAFALDSMTRRVAEQVKFGDSAAAVEMLRHFEKDEIEVSSKVKEQFAAALEKLKLSVKKKSRTAKELRA